MNFIAGIAVVAAVYVCTTSIYKRDTQKYLYFNFLALACALYMIGNFIETLYDTAEASIIGMKISYLGIPFIPPIWYLWVREYCGKKIENIYLILAMMIIPLITAFLAWTWEYNHLLFKNYLYTPGTETIRGNLITEPGPFFIVKQIYLYGFSVLGFYTLVNLYIRGTRYFRQQALFFVASALLPIFNTSAYIVDFSSIGLGTLRLDLTPYALAATLLALSFIAPRYGLSNFSSILKDNTFDHLHESILLFDRDKIFMDSNASSKELFPELKSVPLGTSLKEMHYLPFTEDLFRAYQEGHNIMEFSREHEGATQTYSIAITSVKPQGKVLGYSVIIYNITALKKIMDDLEAKAHIDPLTGLYNRRYFFERGNAEVDRVKRSHGALSLVMFDLDHFKSLNDTHGHPFGDFVLKNVSQISSAKLRKTDILGRYGGEEFCLILPDTALEGAFIKAESIRSRIMDFRFEDAGCKANVTASFGIATFDHTLEGGDDLEKLLKRADENLYKAKAQGRNRVVGPEEEASV